MATTREKRPPPSFEVVFRRQGLTPESLPLNVIAEALSAVQRLASGLDVENASQVPEQHAIGLLQVKRGSAVFACVAHNPTSAMKHLRFAGRILASPDTEFKESVDFVLSPVRTLSRIAFSLDCQILVRSATTRDQLLAEISGDAWNRISRRLLVSGDTTLVGKVVRVGGATRLKCALRIEGRDRLLFCDVRSRELARQLGQFLYAEISATGRATWLERNWKVVAFEIASIEPLRRGGILEAFKSLREAGGKAWDEIDDPETMLRKVRS